MAEFAYTEALHLLGGHASMEIDRILEAACPPDADPVVYLADLGRQVLLPLGARVPAENVDGTPAGDVFTTGQPAASSRDGYVRLWVPVTEQTARIGVLAVSLPDAGRDSVRQAELLGVFTGLAVGAITRSSDTPRIRRQGKRMSLPASMQWDILPPWAIRVPGALAAGILEPAYDVAGDAFDYAFDDGILHFAVIDGMGHGIGSTLLAGLAIGAYRHARRIGTSVTEIHAAIDRALARGYDDMSFATGIIGTLSVATGRLEWTCAGHPPPILLRGHDRPAELACAPTLPFGLGGGEPEVSSLDLEPADAVLLYTDGITEAHTLERELFGLGRLTDLIARESEAGHQPEELLRRMISAVLDYQAGDLRDDLTLLLLRWTGPAAA
jgi:phosphoserine phosphatase RsbU/P